MLRMKLLLLLLQMCRLLLGTTVISLDDQDSAVTTGDAVNQTAAVGNGGFRTDRSYS